jgi:hypothetical protein
LLVHSFPVALGACAKEKNSAEYEDKKFLHGEHMRFWLTDSRSLEADGKKSRMKIHCINLLALLAAFAVAPFFLNRKIRVVRRKLIDAKPVDLFPFINDLRNWPLWTEWPRRETVHYTFSGPESGVGAVQSWETVQMDGVLTLTDSVTDAHIGFDHDVANGKYHMEGVIALEPVGEQTLVTWVCTWRSNEFPLLRYVDLVCKWMLSRDFEAGLENLRLVAENRSDA